MHVISLSPLLSVCVQVECPDYPEDLQHWISFISASSQALRAQSGLEDKTGAQEDKDK